MIINLCEIINFLWVASTHKKLLWSNISHTMVPGYVASPHALNKNNNELSIHLLKQDWDVHF